MYRVENYNRNPFTKRFLETIVFTGDHGEIKEIVDAYLLKEFGGKVDDVRFSVKNKHLKKNTRILVWGRLL